MNWPIRYKEGSSFVWGRNYQPEIIPGKKTSLKDLVSIMQTYEPTFPQRHTNFSLQNSSPQLLYRTWRLIMMVLIPMMWLFIIIRISRQLSVGGTLTKGLELTLLFILLLAFGFAGISIYGIYRKHQDRLDIIDQLDMLYYHFNDEEFTEENLSEIIEERHGRLYWKEFRLSWELSGVFPSMNIIDLIAIFLGMFNMVYIMVWSLNLLVLPVLSGLRQGINLYLLLLDLIFFLTFILLLLLGIQYGKKQTRTISWISSNSQSFRLKHLSLVIGSMTLIILIDLLFRGITPSFLIITLFGPLPILSAFVTSRLLYLRDYIRVRTSYRRQLEFLRISYQEGINPVRIAEASNRIDNQSLLPTSKLRSYLLVVTAVISLLIPIMTGFLSSVSRLDDILRIIFPY